MTKTLRRADNGSVVCAKCELAETFWTRFRGLMGRPSLPADLVGSVLVLKELFDLSDAHTTEALRFDIRWKVACGRSLTQTSFDPSTLVYWRRRIAASQRPDRVFDAVSEDFAKGKPDLVAAIDKAIADIKADGTYAKLSQKYFGADVSQ